MTEKLFNLPFIYFVFNLCSNYHLRFDTVFLYGIIKNNAIFLVLYNVIFIKNLKIYSKWKILRWRRKTAWISNRSKPYKNQFSILIKKKKDTSIQLDKQILKTWRLIREFRKLLRLTFYCTITKQSTFRRRLKFKKKLRRTQQPFGYVLPISKGFLKNLLSLPTVSNYSLHH